MINMMVNMLSDFVNQCDAMKLFGIGDRVFEVINMISVGESVFQIWDMMDEIMDDLSDIFPAMADEMSRIKAEMVNMTVFTDEEVEA